MADTNTNIIAACGLPVILRLFESVLPALVTLLTLVGIGTVRSDSEPPERNPQMRTNVGDQGVEIRSQRRPGLSIARAFGHEYGDPGADWLKLLLERGQDQYGPGVAGVQARERLPNLSCHVIGKLTVMIIRPPRGRPGRTSPVNKPVACRKDADDGLTRGKEVGHELAAHHAVRTPVGVVPAD